MTILSTAIAYVFDSNGKRHSCRVLLDSGSQPNLMTEQLAKKLNLKKQRLNSAIEVLNNNKINSIEWVETMFESSNAKYTTKLSFLILPKITSEIPSILINKKQFEIPPHINLADPEFHRPAEVDILVGPELFYELLEQNTISLAMPHISLQNSKLGWIVTGRINNNQLHRGLKCNLVRDVLTVQLEKFWRIDKGIETKYLSTEESECEKNCLQNVQRDSEGKYIVSLPFNKKKENLGNSYDIAKRRFFILERRLLKDANLKQKYDEFLEKYEDLGHMQLSTSGPEEGFYMPHQTVIKQSFLSRVVFDGSSLTDTGISLNETLLVRAVIQDGLFSLLIRFRQHRIALSADVEKMYRQFWIHPKDRKFQKILWRKDPDKPVKTYELKTITYGTSAAPFLAVRCLKQLAIDEGSNFPEAAKALNEDFYVDDSLTGADTIEEALQLKNDLIKLTKKGGLI
ncbi:uncharacterized protein LOC122504553 [Leptopilina heterotoma]|uniref:uncharacterized protein LOC122504553 n=1 Tax=Leptopilina heterotoma TaxID=63436 RepID=UPI001CA93D83|nr:uncharacterized protein LOC122504553 [Leptopilina heterotoma]